VRRPNKREFALLALVPALFFLAATAGNTVEDHAVVNEGGAPSLKPRIEAKAAPTEADVVPMRRGENADEPPNLFAGKSWYVPPPPPPAPKPVPPPPPTAPPLPFTYLGRYQEADKPVFFLVRANRILTVSVGDVIDNTYRIDSVAGVKLTLTYLPLNIKQFLDIGGAG
jgi:hypothetical protein